MQTVLLSKDLLAKGLLIVPRWGKACLQICLAFLVAGCSSHDLAPQGEQKVSPPSLDRVIQLQGPLRVMAWSWAGGEVSASLTLLERGLSSYDSIKQSTQAPQRPVLHEVVGLLEVVRNSNQPKTCRALPPLPLIGHRFGDKISLGGIRYFPSPAAIEWSQEQFVSHLFTLGSDNPLTRMSRAPIKLNVPGPTVLLQLAAADSDEISRCLGKRVAGIAWKEDKNSRQLVHSFGILNPTPSQEAAPIWMWTTQLVAADNVSIVGMLTLTQGLSELRRHPAREAEVRRLSQLSATLDATGQLTDEQLRSNTSPEFLQLTSAILGSPMRGSEVYNRVEELFGGLPETSGWTRLTCPAPETRIIPMQGVMLNGKIQLAGVRWIGGGNGLALDFLSASLPPLEGTQTLTYGKTSPIYPPVKGPIKLNEYPFQSRIIG